MDEPPYDEHAVADMILTLVKAPAEKRLSTLAMVMKIVIEGHLPRFEDVVRRKVEGK